MTTQSDAQLSFDILTEQKRAKAMIFEGHALLFKNNPCEFQYEQMISAANDLQLLQSVLNELFVKLTNPTK